MAQVSVQKRVGKTKTTYRVRYLDPATGKVIHGGTFTRKKDADAIASKIRTDIERGGWFDPTEGRATTLRRWTAIYADSRSGRRESTRVRDRIAMDQYWLPYLGDMPLSAITARHVIETLETHQQTLAPLTVRTAFGVLNATLNAAVDRELIQRNPCAGARRSLPAAERKTEIRFLSAKEITTLASHTRQDWRIVILLAGVVGLRWSEIAGLRVRRIDFDNATITVAETTSQLADGRVIEHTQPKSKAGRRTITAPQFVIDDLATHLDTVGRRQPEDLIIEAPGGGPVNREWFRSRVLNPACKTSGIKVTIHELRHSAAGLMLAAGVHPKVMQLRLGHATIATTLNLYGHVSDAAEAAVATTLDGTFRDLRLPEPDPEPA